MSGKRKRFIKIEITLLAFIAALTSLTLAYTGPGEWAAAPSSTQNQSSATQQDIPITEPETPGTTAAESAVSDTQAESAPSDNVTIESAPPDQPGSTPPATQPTPDERYITLNMDDYDIASGELILVNYEHSFTIPEKGGLVAVAGYKSGSYVLLDGDAKLAEKIMKPLNAMLDGFAAATGIKNVLLYSTFRTLNKQQAVLDDWIRRVGREEAEMMAANPGYSEHHTGLAFDLAIYKDGAISTFKGAGQYAWIHENAYKYGFILRYQETKQDITKTVYEPWHFRYVGVPHAYFIGRYGYSFEEYMIYIRGFDFGGAHLFDVYDGVLYEIYYIEGTKVPVPSGLDYTLSGDNVSGFIVTVRHGEAHGRAVPEAEKLEVNYA